MVKSTPNIHRDDISILFTFLISYKSPDWSSMNKQIPWNTVAKELNRKRDVMFLNLSSIA